MGKKSHRAKDKYYKLAKEQGYRARSAFKLIQLNKKYDFLSSATCLLDLCAAPGGWCQVAGRYMPAGSTIIGVDLVPIRPIRNVITHAADITTARCRALLRKDMGPKKADVVLHDGAPNVGADWAKDAFTQSELVLCSLKLAVEFLRPGGLFITKVFRSADYNSLMWVFGQLFKRVEATKPMSSRNASAEIFVVCQGYHAPAKLDPRMLDPAYVFEDLGMKPKKVDILHGKAGKQKRNREGYDESLGMILHKTEHVSAFFDSDDPVRVLSEVNQLIFDPENEQDAEIAAHPLTTEEVRTQCSDLKLLSKTDFKLLLRWRSKILRERTAALRAERAEAARAAESEVAPLTEEEKAAAEEAALEEELHEASLREAQRAKREKKRVAKERQKQLRRKALGMDKVAVDMVDDPDLFSLKDIPTSEALDVIRSAELGSAPDPAGGAVDDDGIDFGDQDSDSASDSGSSEGDDADRYQSRLEEELDAAYDTRREKLAGKASAIGAQAADAAKLGKKLTRKQRMAVEASAKEQKALARLDAEHDRYLKLLASAKGSGSSRIRGGAGGPDGEHDGVGGFYADRHDESSDDSSDDEATAARNPLVITDDDVVAADESKRGQDPMGAARRAERWFSQSLFEDAEVDDDAAAVQSSRRLAGDTGSSDSEDEPTDVPSAKRPRFGSDAEDDAGSDAELPDAVKEVDALLAAEGEKSERVKRKERAAKKRARDARKTARGELEPEHGFLEVPADSGDPSLKEKSKAHKALIKAGMGASVKESKSAAKDEGYEVVAAGAAGAGGGSAGHDPRDEDYDSDTHAELLALAGKLRKHTTAKALMDASYNRYAFNDDNLPRWFEDDERTHFRPQLPITKEEVNAIKERFRDIVARPIHKVAEARARKRRRVEQRMETAKKKATVIAAQEDMGEREKARAIQKAYKRAELKRPSAVKVISRAGKRVAQTGKKKGGGGVKFVDARLRSDTRAMDRAKAKKMGSKRKAKGKGKRKR